MEEEEEEEPTLSPYFSLSSDAIAGSSRPVVVAA